MYHPFEDGVFYEETHFPEVRIFRAEKRIEVTVFVRKSYLEHLPVAQNFWSYQQSQRGEWSAFFFRHVTSRGNIDLAEIKSLNYLLSECAVGSCGDETAKTDCSHKAQTAFVQATNPEEFGMGAYGLWANFAAPVTKVLKAMSRTEALEVYVTSRMQGACKILAPDQRYGRKDCWMRLSRGRNPVPIFQTFGNCACLSVTSNEVQENSSFLLSPHNVDGHTQQFLLLLGTLVFWQRLRKQTLQK